MALNLYNQTAHKIEYGKANFNYKIEEVNEFLCDECPSFSGSDDDTDFALSLIINKSDLQNLVERMEADKDSYKDKIPDKDYSVDEFIGVVKEWINTSPKDDDVVYLDWF